MMIVLLNKVESKGRNIINDNRGVICRLKV